MSSNKGLISYQGKTVKEKKTSKGNRHKQKITIKYCEE